jgi:hypothetical protein
VFAKVREPLAAPSLMGAVSLGQKLLLKGSPFSSYSEVSEAIGINRTS